MKDGRDWSNWGLFDIDSQEYIIRVNARRRPFPSYREFVKTDRKPKTPIFKIDVWGVKEPK